MKIIFESKGIDRFGNNVTISISEPETGRIYGYSVKQPSEIGTTGGVFGTYIRSYDELADKEIIASIIKKSGVKIVE